MPVYTSNLGTKLNTKVSVAWYILHSLAYFTVFIKHDNFYNDWFREKLILTQLHNSTSGMEDLKRMALQDQMVDVILRVLVEHDDLHYYQVKKLYQK